MRTKARDNLFAALFFVMVVGVIILTGCASKNNSVSNTPDTITTSVTDGTDAVSVPATGETSVPDSSVQTDQTVTENPTITDITISPSETELTDIPTETPLPTDVTIEPTETPTPKPTATKVPTKVPTKAPTKKVTPTPTDIPYDLLPPPTITPYEREKVYTVHYEILDLINTARAKEGLKPFTWNDDLNEIAKKRIDDVEQLVKEHPEIWDDADAMHSGMTKYIDKNGDRIIKGEVLNFGSLSAEDAFNSWMRSTGHRNSLLANGTENVVVPEGSEIWALTSEYPDGHYFQSGEVIPGLPCSISCVSDGYVWVLIKTW